VLIEEGLILSMESKPLKITTIGLDERGLKVIKFFIERFCAERAIIVSAEAETEVFMINMDSVRANNELNRIKTAFPAMPIIHMALYAVECYPHFFIRKPIIAKHFLEILTEIESLPNRQLPKEHIELVQVNSQRADLDNEKVFEQFDKPKKTVATKVAAKINKARVAEFAGVKDDIDLSSNTISKEIYFDPRDYYLFYVQEAITRAKSENKTMKLTGLWQTVIICPRFNLVYMTKSDKKLRSFCAAKLNNSHKERMLIDETAFSCEELGEIEGEDILKNSSSDNLYDLESFLWKVSLWTARGRLPLGTDMNQLFQVQSWPNFTRLVSTPHSFNLTAYWAAKPRSLLDTVSSLGFKQRYIFSLYTAMTILNNIAFSEPETVTGSSSEDKPKKTSSRTRKLVTLKTKRLFGNVIKKLRLSHEAE
jgi:hypothetical protein